LYLGFTGSKMVVTPLHYTSSRNNYKPEPKGPLELHYNKQPEKIFSTNKQICKFAATPTSYDTNQPYFHKSKLLSITEKTSRGPEVCTTQHVIPSEPRDADRGAAYYKVFY
jgi:hypothetical protein